MRISLAILSTIAGVATLVAIADPLPPDASYRPLPTVPLDVVRRNDRGSEAGSHAASAEFAQRAADTLPDVMEHLEMAKRQYAMLTSAAPPAK
jgi:hypothetical protein